MASLKITSKNAGVSIDDRIKQAAENVYVNILTEYTSVVTEYTDKCLSGDLENNEASLQEFLKLKNYVPAEPTNTGSKVASGKAVDILRGATSNARGAAKGKDLSDEQYKMFHEINEGTWNYGWHQDKCQRFITSGVKVNKFCGEKPCSGDIFCKKCANMSTTSKLIDRFEKEDLTPEAWYEEKVKKAQEIAAERLGMEKGQSVKKDAVKKVARGPPLSKAPATNTSAKEKLTLRTYNGKDKSATAKWLWARFEGLGGCVFDEDKNLIGLAKLCSAQTVMTKPSAADKAKFEKLSANIEISSEPEKEVVKKPQPPTKVVSEEEDVEEEEEDVEEEEEKPQPKKVVRPPPKPMSRVAPKAKAPSSEEEEIIEMDDEEEDIDAEEDL